MFTVLLRKASGAGYYAMAGLPYEPVVQLSTALARQSVMEGRTLAIATFNTRLDDDFSIPAHLSAEERSKLAADMERTAARIERDMDPIAAAGRMDTDEVVCLSELRDYLVALAEMSWSSTGHRRTKNPRIWSLHDLEVIGGGRRTVAAATERVVVEAPVSAEAPEPGLVAVVAPMEGTFWSRPSPGSPAFVALGAEAQAGEGIALIEVMKTFTPIRAAGRGVLVSWVVADGQGVRPGALLGWLRPA
jgi:biotin carboxyl carrier protein